MLSGGTPLVVHPPRVKQRLTTLCLVLLAACLGAHGEEPPALWFPVGERLVYRVYWGIIPVGWGEVSSEWQDEAPAQTLLLRFRVYSNRFFSKLYPVDDRIESTIRADGFQPVQLVKRTSEGSTRFDDVLTFDRTRGVAVWTNHLKGRTAEYSVPPGCDDLVSFMFRLRKQAFEPGEILRPKVAVDDRLQEFIIRTGDREPVNLPELGVIPSIRMTVQTPKSGFFVQKIPGSVWVSDDEARIVTRMNVKIPVGSVKVLLFSRTIPGGAEGPTPPLDGDSM